MLDQEQISMLLLARRSVRLPTASGVVFRTSMWRRVTYPHLRNGSKVESVSVTFYESEDQKGRLLRLRICCSVILDREFMPLWRHVSPTGIQHWLVAQIGRKFLRATVPPLRSPCACRPGPADRRPDYRKVGRDDRVDTNARFASRLSAFPARAFPRHA